MFVLFYYNSPSSICFRRQSAVAFVPLSRHPITTGTKRMRFPGLYVRISEARCLWFCNFFLSPLLSTDIPSRYIFFIFVVFATFANLILEVQAYLTYFFLVFIYIFHRRRRYCLNIIPSLFFMYYY